MAEDKEYGGFIRRIKEYQAPFNDQVLLAEIESRLAPNVLPVRLALAGALMIMLIGLAGYWVNLNQTSGRLTMADYVFQPEIAGDNVVINYVFK